MDPWYLSHPWAASPGWLRSVACRVSWLCCVSKDREGTGGVVPPLNPLKTETPGECSKPSRDSIFLFSNPCLTEIENPGHQWHLSTWLGRGVGYRPVIPATPEAGVTELKVQCRANVLKAVSEQKNKGGVALSGRVPGGLRYHPQYNRK